MDEESGCSSLPSPYSTDRTGPIQKNNVVDRHQSSNVDIPYTELSNSVREFHGRPDSIAVECNYRTVNVCSNCADWG